jgi:streptogramin lyase
MPRIHFGLLLLLPLTLALGCQSESIVGSARDAGIDAMVAVDAPLDVQAKPRDTVTDVSRCSTGQRECNGLCVSVAIDPANCGACGTRCADTERCVEGQCRVSCPGSQIACPVAVGDAGMTTPLCVSLDTDRNHCGACGVRCGPGQVCSNGMCTTSCAELLTTCSDPMTGAYCADLRRDPRNCGECGRGCAPGQSCEGSRCVTTCSTGFSACMGTGGTPGYCAELQTDRNNCGACGTVCAAGQVCAMGSCQVSCGASLTECLGVCRDLQTDRSNCGACSTVCAQGEVCSAGRCEVSCGAGLANCDGSCRDLQTDRAHCGACGMACAAGQVCSAGTCRISCVDGLTACGNSCRDLQTDRANCGACGMGCTDGQVCTGGMCRLSCPMGATGCNGLCVNTQTDNANCGACGTVCPAGQVCSTGRCATTCGAGLTSCGGDCTNTRFDPVNCGACGTACGPYANATAACTAGSCVQTCSAGFADCNENRGDGCERNLAADLGHCGRCGAACPMRANATVSCTMGTCGFTCMPNFADCDGNPSNGCEADLRSDAANCGRCGTACTVANGVGQCTAGACGLARCNGTFQNCDNNLANGCEHDTRLSCNSCDLECRDSSVGGTGRPFTAEGLRGTAVNPMQGGLVVGGMSSTTVADYLWVVNTAESTMSKWDATGARELARYRVGLSTGECRSLCCYNNGCNMPSRVVVDGVGDAYVASRGFASQGTVTKIAADRSNCVDRNNNGMIDTSTGSSNVLAYGADECVLWTAPVGPVDAVLRAIATDRGDTMNPSGYVWVGGYNNFGVYRLNPRTGAVLNTFTAAVRPYGMVVTGNGTLWVTTLDGAAMQPFNTTALTAGTSVPYPLSLRGNCRNAYGLTADGAGRIWLAGWDCRDAIGYNPATNQWTRVDLPGLIGGTAGRGITVDADGRVWLAYATSSDGPSGGLLSWDSNRFAANANIPSTAVTRHTLPGGFSGPSALGVDRVGNIWLAHYQAPSALVRYTPSSQNAVVLYGANQVYSYSDFTGSVRRTSLAQGSYEETIDLGCDNPVFTTFRWTATTATGTSITFTGRTAATPVALGPATPVTVALAPRDSSPVDLAAAFRAASVTAARQFRITVSMQSSETGATPVLTSFNLGWRCPR